MTTKSRTGLLSNLGMVAALSMGLTIASHTAAVAAAAEFTVTPTTGLSDGQTLVGSIAGARPNETYGYAQCADLNGVAACNPDSAGWGVITTDGNGAGGFEVTVRRSYEGSTPEGTPVGPVNCDQVVCYIGAAHPDDDLGFVPISFE